jgi:CRP/FNR family transcriptional regulator, anaerobic regulatory protein
MELPRGHPCEDCLIRPITICRRLDPRTLANLRSLGSPQRLQAGQPIFHEGDAVNRVFMLASGSLKIYTLLADGRRQVTGFMFPGDFLGISIDHEYAFTAEALSDAELWWFSRQAFDAFVEQNLEVERELYRLAAHELAAAQQQMVLLGRKTAAERLASFFLMLLERKERVSGKTENRFELSMARVDIADYLGLTKETVSRMIALLRDRRFVRLVAQDEIEIVDRAGLQEMASGEEEG